MSLSKNRYPTLIKVVQVQTPNQYIAEYMSNLNNDNLDIIFCPEHPANEIVGCIISSIDHKGVK